MQNLLKIAKLDSGTIVMDKHTEMIAEMMDDIQRRFAYRAKQEEKIFLLLGNDSVTFPCDRSWFLEAIGNIVKNAFDHTEKAIPFRSNGNSLHLWSKSS